MFDRGESAGAQICTDWSDGVSWMAHPEEGGQRVSHAIRTADGVWLLDPLDAPDIDRVLADFGAVAGVAVLSCWHSRDADVFADRYDVPVSVPDWMGRVEQRIDAPLERYSGSFPDSSIRAIPNRPFSIWDEMVLSRGQRNPHRSRFAGDDRFVPSRCGTTRLAAVTSDQAAAPIERPRAGTRPRWARDGDHGEQERCPSGSAQVASETGSTSARRKRSCDPPEYHQNGRLNAVRLRPVTCRRLSPTGVKIRSRCVDVDSGKRFVLTKAVRRIQAGYSTVNCRWN